MVQKYVVHNTEMNRVNDGDLHDNEEWSLVVTAEDYRTLELKFLAAVAGNAIATMYLYQAMAHTSLDKRNEFIAKALGMLNDAKN